MTVTERLLLASSVGLAAGAVLMGGGSGLSWFAAVPCLLFGAALIGWLRSPDASSSALVLLAAGFVRMLLGPLGVAALLLVPVLAHRADPHHARHLVRAAVGVHLAVFAANQLATALGEPFPTLATLSPSEALIGLALFAPFTLLAAPSTEPEEEP